MVILDTCAVIRLAESLEYFSDQTLKKIADQATILSISFAEIACKIKRKKLDLSGISAKALLKNYKSIPAITIADISAQLWLQAIDLELYNAKGQEHKDPADRLILAYAQSKNCPIVTTDKILIDNYENCIW